MLDIGLDICYHYYHYSSFVPANTVERVTAAFQAIERGVESVHHRGYTGTGGSKDFFFFL